MLFTNASDCINYIVFLQQLTTIYFNIIIMNSKVTENNTDYYIIVLCVYCLYNCTKIRLLVVHGSRFPFTQSARVYLYT